LLLDGLLVVGGDRLLDLVDGGRIRQDGHGQLGRDVFQVVHPADDLDEEQAPGGARSEAVPLLHS
jgi:hypothetical protein